MKNTVLIVDDETTLRLSLRMFLSDEGYDAADTGTIKEAWELLHNKDFNPSIVLLDIRLPDGNGLEMLRELKSTFPDMEVIMLTAYGDTDTAVSAIKGGAFDYLTKPFELEEIQIVIEKCLKHRHLEDEVERYRQEEKRINKTEIIGESDVMQQFKNQLGLVADSENTTVLIKGETGTGKELVARNIHQLSSRANQPFVPVNCGAIPSHLFESELFGYEKGAFTGANQQKKGLVEWAEGGTLFLDEIGEVPIDIQVKLLRFLEEKKIMRVGGVKNIDVDVRVIGATNRPLSEMIEKGEFRSDLYYRLNILPLKLPPLRDRGEDCLILARHFLRDYSRQMRKKLPKLAGSAEQTFMTYHWPGNVREMKNVIERLMILHHEDTIKSEHLDFLKAPTDSQAKPAKEKVTLTEGFSIEEHIETIERDLIKQALEETKWNVTKSAEILGLSRYALHRRIEKYNLK
ncbi:sigma-54 dependent transcriptional regulator [Bacillus tianshenii]|nr:sigma-54 dependent transcriptional regulator [Bacillus tianshenii]